MKHYLFDTNILIMAIRQDANWSAFQTAMDLDNSYNFISIVTVGEIWSLAYQRNWGRGKVTLMSQILEQFIILDINIENIVQQYAKIDALSQGNISTQYFTKEELTSLAATPKHSARNMGKNDLWIAATASAFNLTLLTKDHDFDHLATWILLEKIH